MHPQRCPGLVIDAEHLDIDTLFNDSQVPHRWLAFSSVGARIILVSVDG